MTGGSYRTHCDDCESEIRSSARYCPDCGERQQWFIDDEETDGNLEEVFRRETITEAADGGLQVGEREVVDRDSSAWWYVESENKRDGGEE